MISTLRGQSLLSLEGLEREALVEVLDTAESFVEVNSRAIKKVPALKGRVVASLFYEESTRTRLSFETAAKRLSADVLSLAVASSSVKKGESLRDTIATIDALGIDAVVMRHQSSGAAMQVSRYVPHVRVINAGDGQHQRCSRHDQARELDFAEQVRIADQAARCLSGAGDVESPGHHPRRHHQ